MFRIINTSPKLWRTPAGNIPAFCVDMKKQPHLLIAGATGSGKSVLIHNFIYTLLYQAPPRLHLVLIDPKRVELYRYKDLPHIFYYASESENIYNIFRFIVEYMDNRYKTMQRNGQTKTTEKDIYIIIDEFADLMTTDKKRLKPLICRIAQLGRAAGIHLVIATQRPTADIIDGQIKVNIDGRIALRCPTKQDSRNIINTGGAETLPRFGYCYYLTPETIKPELRQITPIPDTEIKRIINHWMAQK